MEKKKIGVFVDSFFPVIDGVNFVVDNHIKRLSSNYEVFLAAPGRQEDNKNFSYKIYRCKKITSRFVHYPIPIPNLDFDFFKNIKAEKADLIHIHSPFSLGKIGIKMAKKLDIPVVATLHSQYHRDFLKYTKSKTVSKLMVKMIANVYNKCNLVLVMNKELDDLLHSYGYNGKTIILPNGTDMKYPSNPENANRLINEKHQIREDEAVLLFVGRLVELKGLSFLVESLNELKNSGLNFKMIFIGAGQDEENIKNKINLLNLSSNVIFTGKIIDRELLASYYHRADLFLFPSLYDADSLVQKEAAVNKTPTVFLKGSITSSSIIDNQTGFLAENNPSLFANRVKEILENKILLNSVSENCYKAQNSWDDIVVRLSSIYEEVIQQYKKKIKN